MPVAAIPAETKAQIVSLIKDSAAEVTVATFPAAYKRRWGAPMVASLIGAKGLGEDVLEALQYANVGQGILAGFAILFCAMILDRIVQGKRK